MQLAVFLLFGLIQCAYGRKDALRREDLSCSQVQVVGRSTHCCNGGCLDETSIFDDTGMCRYFNDACKGQDSPPEISETQVMYFNPTVTQESGDGPCYVQCQWEQYIFNYSVCECPDGYFGTQRGEACPDSGPLFNFHIFCAGCSDPDEVFVGTATPNPYLPDFYCLNKQCTEPTGETCAFYSDCLDDAWDTSCGREGYAQRFGSPMCNLYLNDEENLFSKEGAAWSAKVRKCLQAALVPILTSPEPPSCEEIEELALDSHSPCYIEEGYCDLPISDGIALLSTITNLDLDDIISAGILGQLFSVAWNCFPTWLDRHFASTKGAILDLVFLFRKRTGSSLEVENGYLLYAFYKQYLLPNFSQEFLIYPLLVFREDDDTMVFQLFLLEDDATIVVESAQEIERFFEAKNLSIGSYNLTLASSRINVTEPLLGFPPSDMPSSEPTVRALPSSQPSGAPSNTKVNEKKGKKKKKGKIFIRNRGGAA